MDELGWLLYVVAAVLVVWIFRRLPSLSLEALVDTGRREHDAVKRMNQAHPLGGRAAQVERWLEQSGE